MSAKTLSREDEEKIIEFVKCHEILFKVKHGMFRNTEAKNRLWLQLANELHQDVENVKKKWISMRDYFIRNKQKKITGSAASCLNKRDEALMFLMDTSIISRPTLTNLSGNETELECDDDLLSVASESADTHSNLQTPEPPSAKGRRSTSTNDIASVLKEFLHRKRPDEVPLPKKDNLTTFFNAIADTMRSFPPVSIANLKLKIGNLVGQEEIALAERNAEIFYIGEEEV